MKKGEHREILERLTDTVAVLDGMIEMIDTQFDELDYLQYEMMKEQLGEDYEIEIAPERVAWSWALGQVRERMKWYVEYF